MFFAPHKHRQGARLSARSEAGRHGVAVRTVCIILVLHTKTSRRRLVGFGRGARSVTAGAASLGSACAGSGKALSRHSGAGAVICRDARASSV